ncbi:MAG: NusG domain II-containing protein [Oscillospiraceae bacterium]|jgi:hypothetical protein|nr:NusG domain II-containing protein [Oscillospiraceae bacterium]
MRRGDIITALALLALAGALLLLRPGGAGGVYVNGAAASESTTVNGVAVEIAGRRARVADSPCRDRLCVRAGWLERPGDVAVCLPQRVIVEIRGAGRGVDGVAG